MLNYKELKSLLERGRALQEKISAFIKKDSTALPLLELTKHIDDLIDDIKPQLLEPSASENNELGLLISNLGRIAQNFKDIKPMLNHITPSTPTFFKLNKPQSVLQELIGNLNQLENSLGPKINHTPAT